MKDYKCDNYSKANEIDNTISYICGNEYEYFLNKCNVVGIGLGYKIKNGFYTNIKCIKVFVTQKLPEDGIMSQDIIPMYYKGIPTDVDESGSLTMSMLKNKCRPVTGGYGICPITGDSVGTMGCLVTDGRYYHVLSNNHVLACEGRVKIGTNILQPCMNYGGHNPEDAIATLTKYVPMHPITDIGTPINYVDCAIGKIIKRSQVSTKITFIGRVKGTIAPMLNMKVQKVGATTELTKGTIQAINATYKINSQRKIYIFKNQIITTCMTRKGDSGSILLDENMKAVGLFMADGSSLSAFNDIGQVLRSLNVRIVTG